MEAALKKRPMDEALKQELRRHAERVARIERVQELAQQSADTAALERAKKLLEQETARHQAFLDAQQKAAQ